MLDGSGAELLLEPTVRITTAAPGVHVGGTVYRKDEVPIPRTGALPYPYHSDAAVLNALERRVLSSSREGIERTELESA